MKKPNPRWTREELERSWTGMQARAEKAEAALDELEAKVHAEETPHRTRMRLAEAHLTEAHAAIAANDARHAEAIAAVRARAEHAEAELNALAKYITQLPAREYRHDHACAECVPGGPVVVAGFRCAVHIAIAVRATTSASNGGDK